MNDQQKEQLIREALEQAQALIQSAAKLALELGWTKDSVGYDSILTADEAVDEAILTFDS